MIAGRKESVSDGDPIEEPSAADPPAKDPPRSPPDPPREEPPPGETPSKPPMREPLTPTGRPLRGKRGLRPRPALK